MKPVMITIDVACTIAVSIYDCEAYFTLNLYVSRIMYR